MIPSAHLDSFARDNLPARAQWPDFLFNLPELRYPDRMNCVAELLDRWIETGDGDRPCLISPSQSLTYSQLAEWVLRKLELPLQFREGAFEGFASSGDSSEQASAALGNQAFEALPSGQ